MGAACCCLCGDFEDYMNPNSNVYRDRLCLRCFVENVLNAYGSVFRRGQQHAPLLTAIQGTPATSLDNSLCDMYRSPPRPLPYDAEPGYFRSQIENPSHDKGSSHCHEETESQPLRSYMEMGSESLNTRNKWVEKSREEGKRGNYQRSSMKLSAEKAAIGFAHIYSSYSEDEDVCPTCLDEYTPENPKLITKCCHHFHLGCIYEWMERSETCPVCGKIMVEVWWSLLGAAVPAIIAGQAFRIKKRRADEQKTKSARGREKTSDDIFVCERVCTSKRMLKKVGAFSKDPIPDTCVTVCGVSEIDACSDACARTVCVNQHQVPNWNDVCLRRCQSECLKLSASRAS